MAWETWEEIMFRLGRHGNKIWYGLKDMGNDMIWLGRHEKIIWYGLEDMGGNYVSAWKTWEQNMVWIERHGK